MISKYQQKQLVKILSEGKNKDPIQGLKITLLKQSINQYNQAIEALNKEGYIVESYKQKYLNPNYKISVNALKEIINLLNELNEEHKEDIDKINKEKLVKELLLF